MSSFKTCPLCRNYLIAQISDEKLNRVCKTCGYSVEDKGGLIMETYVKQKSSDSYKILLNEFTRQDPTLPYLKDLKCPNGQCSSNKETAEKKVYLIKYDVENLKFVYICNNCEQTWTTR
uniref:DNA-directed RNA polymerase M/15kDa subunit domain-containing protein n=1 Tax=viral metagenome TaxID=1070528 RepID=A0A6C0D9Q5_9ZZZZ